MIDTYRGKPEVSTLYNVNVLGACVKERQRQTERACEVLVE